MAKKDEGKILLVDSDHFRRAQMLSSLENSGFKVKEAESGFKATYIIDRMPVSLMIISTHVDDMALDELIALTRDYFSSSKLPILLIIDKDLQETAQELKETAINDYLIRPINYMRLTEMIDNYLGRSNC